MFKVGVLEVCRAELHQVGQASERAHPIAELNVDALLIGLLVNALDYFLNQRVFKFEYQSGDDDDDDDINSIKRNFFFLSEWFTYLQLLKRQDTTIKTLSYSKFLKIKNTISVLNKL